MLNTISWHEYFLFISALLILYYGFIFVFYFKMNFFSLLKTNQISFFSGKELKSKMSWNAEKVILEIGPSFSGKQNLNELIYDLQIKLEPYKFWDEPDFKKSINDFIIEESEKKCSIHLSEEDLRVLWL